MTAAPRVVVAGSLLSSLLLARPMSGQPSATPSVRPSPVDALAWLSGCWSHTNGTRTVEEQWQAPRAGMMMGLGRTIVGDSLVDHEVMRIFARGDTLFFAAHPAGQAPTTFRAAPPRGAELVFSNPAHDFPQRVRYRPQGDSLLARVEGTRNGVERGIDFRYARVPCPSGARPNPPAPIP